MAQQPDGKFVLAGEIFDQTETDAAALFAGTNREFGLVRYNNDGTLDQSFGIGGVVMTDLGGSDRAYSITLQSDGKIIAGGQTLMDGNSDLAIVRYNTDGSLDQSFGNGGLVITDVEGRQDKFHDVELSPDGKIVGVGSCLSAERSSLPTARRPRAFQYLSSRMALENLPNSYLCCCRIQPEARCSAARPQSF